MKRLYFDFWGPTAEPMARHFASHLSEFLGREGVKAQGPFFEHHEPSGMSVSLLVEDEQVEALSRSLRPRRILAESSDELPSLPSGPARR